ncbi:MAG TPA: carbohydrate kinase family protein [Opitutus sp.]|nr:carbohydrate kinase family protein [Opitutus sp.]
MRSGIIAGGNWIVDHVKRIDTWPPQDALASILSESWGNGGSPYNLLKNLSRFGATFSREAVGLVGNDESGRIIQADCTAHGIDQTQLRITEAAPTSYTDVMTEVSTSRRTFFHQRGANALLAPEHFDFSTTRAKLFHLGYLLLLDALDAPGADGLPKAAEVFRRARAAGLRTSADCVSEHGDRFTSVVAPLLPEVDLLFANDFEAEKITGLQLGRGQTLDPAAVEAAGGELLRRGVREWVFIHFPEGVCACSAKGERVWQASVKMPVNAIAGTAGAGDALASGVLYGWHEGWPMQKALELGVCAAAASLRHPTCSDAVGSLDECLGLGAQYGFQVMPTRR